jgi:hypothetical protein
LEDVDIGSKRVKVLGTHGHLPNAYFRKRIPNQHKMIRIWVRQRPQYHRICHAENSRRRANSECDGEESCDSESRVASQLSDGVSQILPKNSDPFSARHIFSASREKPNCTNGDSRQSP